MTAGSDLAAPPCSYGGREASFAGREAAERLAGSVSGSITPFAFSAELDLLVDESLLVHDEIYFNAGRLEMSVALSVTDHLQATRPAVAAITVRRLAGAPAGRGRSTAAPTQLHSGRPACRLSRATRHPFVLKTVPGRRVLIHGVTPAILIQEGALCPVIPAWRGGCGFWLPRPRVLADSLRSSFHRRAGRTEF